jgi:hypothetical protein
MTVVTFPVNGLVATSDAIIEATQRPAQQHPVTSRELGQVAQPEGGGLVQVAWSPTDPGRVHLIRLTIRNRDTPAATGWDRAGRAGLRRPGGPVALAVQLFSFQSATCL